MLLGLKHAALAVENLPRALLFYKKTLGLSPYHTNDKDWAMLSLGATTLSLVPQSYSLHPRHLGFTVEKKEDVFLWHKKISKTKGIGCAPVKKHRDGSVGFYFSDTEGNSLECIFIPYRSHNQNATKKKSTSSEARILVVHGSRHPSSKEFFENFLRDCRLHAPQYVWDLCYLEMQKPPLGSSLKKIASKKQITSIEVLPLFMAEGMHTTRDIPKIVRDFKVGLSLKRRKKLKIKIHPPLGTHDIVKDSLIAAVVLA